MTEAAHPEPATSQGPDRFLLAILGGALGIVILGVVLAVVVSRQPPGPPPDPSTPAGTVHAYIMSLRDGEVDRSYSFLSSGAKASTSLAQYRERYPRYDGPAQSDVRLLLETLREQGDRAEVKVTISRFFGTGLFTRTSHREISLFLVREEGAWKVDRPVEPYALMY